MGIVKDIKKVIDLFKAGPVFGTFDVSYDPLEFERVRDDGTTVIGLCPDCRVFIGGAEVTKDIDSVVINNKMDGNTCTITLQNPRGRYEISKFDLMKKWREDKDILAAYDYKDFDRKDPLNFDKVAQKIGEGIFGPKGGALVGTSIDMIRQTEKTVGSIRSLFGGKPSVRGTTRMLFETKYYSGLVRRVGDCVFDYRDPVYVFMKGRFSTYWYFAFSGIVSAYDDVNAYGDANIITLKCEDVASLWKRTRLSQKAAFYGMSNMENRVYSQSASTSKNIYKDFAQNLTFSNMIKVIAFSADYGKNAVNCHPSYNVNTKNYTNVNSDNNTYNQYMSRLRSGAKMDSNFMVTDAGMMQTFANRLGNIPLIGKVAYGTINTSDINYVDWDNGPNTDPLSAGSSIYLQLNEIRFDKFNGEEMQKNLNLSVRFWETKHEVDSGFDVSRSKGTGWQNKKAFGVCGHHPALKYEFIDNFNILEGIWSQCYDSKNIDNIVMTPYDKVMEAIIGSPTERPMDQSFSYRPTGTNFNLFRPRLFVMLPKRYNSDRLLGADLDGVGKIFDADSSSIADFFKTKLKALEYNYYTSPMGDIFIEPELYDFHPTEFSGKIEARSIVTKSETIGFKENLINDALMNKPIMVKDKAYFFNPDANHPFFIMEKDRIRDTFSFDPSTIVSSVEVQGGATKTGGVAGKMMADSLQKLQKAPQFIAQGSATQVKGTQDLMTGMYTADGFDGYINTKGQQILDANNKLVAKQESYRKYLFVIMVTEAKNEFISDVISYFLTDTEKMITSEFEWESDILTDIKSLLNRETTLSKRQEYVINKYLTSLLTHTKNKDKTSTPDYATLKGKTIGQIFDFKQIKTKDLSISVKNINDVLKKAKDLNDAAANTTDATTSDTSIAINDLLKKWEDLGIFNLKDNTSGAILGIQREAVFQLLTILEPSILYTSDQAMKMYKEISNVKLSATLPRQLRAVTIKDLKDYQRRGFYDPRTDLVRQYGFKKIEPIRNEFIRNGVEVQNYAKSVFNRLLGQANKIETTIIGRPELVLNRPYYFERKDCIGLNVAYTLSFKYGGEFNSNVSLTYVRKNAITYSYSLKELDIIDDTYNKHFSSEGSKYLTWNKVLQQGAAAAGSSLNKFIAGDGSSQKKGILGDIAGDAATTLINEFGPIGGIFTAHGRLGHIPFDSRGIDRDYTVPSISTATSLQFDEGMTEVLTTYSKSIKNLLDDRDLLSIGIDKNTAKYKQLQIDYKNMSNSRDMLIIETEDTYKNPNSKEIDKARLVEEYKAISQTIEGITREINTIKYNIDKDTTDRVIVYQKLYGPGASDYFSTYKEDLDRYTKYLYDGYNSKSPYFSSLTNILDLGLFFALFYTHIANTNNVTLQNADLWEIREEYGLTITEDNNVSYYIKRSNVKIPTAPTQAVNNSGTVA